MESCRSHHLDYLLHHLPHHLQLGIRWQPPTVSVLMPADSSEEEATARAGCNAGLEGFVLLGDADGEVQSQQARSMRGEWGEEEEEWREKR